jgi:hypothetical protein
MADDAELSEVAFYYPNAMWLDGDWIKNLILFFDGVALLVPEYMSTRPEIADPAIVRGLQENGLLHILKPEEFVDKDATEALVSAMADVLNSGALDSLAEDETVFSELSFSRMGYYGDLGLAMNLHNELQRRGLAKDTNDGLSAPMHPHVRSLILVLLSQILRAQGREIGLDLSPATDQPLLVDALRELLDVRMAPSNGHVVTMDMQSVGIDMSSIPIEEVLKYRTENYEAYRLYRRTLRQFTRELSLLPEDERKEALKDRTEEISSQAEQLSHRARGVWKKPASIGLSLTGAAFTLVTGSALGAVLAGGGTILGKIVGAEKSTEANPFSYLLDAPGRRSVLRRRRPSP